MKKKIKKIIKRFIPDFIILFYRKIMVKQLKKEKKNFGKLNSDKTFYIIRRTPAGLFSNYGAVLLHLLEAEKRKLIPIIDYKNYNSYYKEKEKIYGTENFWEYYWEQPLNYTLEQVYKSQNVILSAELPNQKTIWNSQFLDDSLYIEKLNEVSKKIKLNKRTQSYVNKMYKNIIPKDKKILGVKIRGSDYNFKKPKGHPIQPKLEDIIELIKNRVKEWKIDYIYLATEEENTLEKMKKEFGNKLLFLKKEMIKNYDHDLIVTEVRFNRKNDRYLSGLEYLTEIEILSKCNSIITASNSGAVAAIILNGNQYENKYIINLGVYD